MKEGEVYNYKGESITKLKSGYTVFYEGDEIFFKDIKSAKEFVDANGINGRLT